MHRTAEILVLEEMLGYRAAGQRGRSTFLWARSARPNKSLTSRTLEGICEFSSLTRFAFPSSAPATPSTLVLCTPATASEATRCSKCWYSSSSARRRQEMGTFPRKYVHQIRISSIIISCVEDRCQRIDAPEDGLLKGEHVHAIQTLTSRRSASSRYRRNRSAINRRRRKARWNSMRRGAHPTSSAKSLLRRRSSRFDNHRKVRARRHEVVLIVPLVLSRVPPLL